MPTLPLPDTWEVDGSAHVRCLRSSEAILACAAELHRFAEACQQPCSLQWLRYFLSGAGQLWKRPCLVVLLRPGTEAEPLRAENMGGCVLYSELRAGGVGTGVYLTEDWGGLRSVVGCEPYRASITAQATEALFARGARLVLTTYACSEKDDGGPVAPVLKTPGKWSLGARQNTLQRLTLEPTWDAMLAKLGKKTRDNLRYYRKRLGQEVGCEFVPDAFSQMSRSDYEALNRNSLNPVPKAECMRRYDALQNEAGSFLVGVRTLEGEWLTVLGGWRQNDVTVMHHQMNRAGYDRYSLGHVMRSFFLEDEIRRGTRAVIFYHGTAHSMTHVFDVEHMRDLFAVRPGSVRVKLLRRLSRKMAGEKDYRESVHFGGGIRFLGTVLAEESLEAKPPNEQPDNSGQLAA